MRYYLALISLISLPCFVSAQSNYKAGYIIKLNADTLHGFINYREWQHNPREVMFKATLNNPAQKFTVLNSSGFGVNGAEFYDKGVVSVSTSPVELSRLPDSKDTTQITDTVFLKKIVSGDKVNLYVYNDEIKARYYIKDNRTGNNTALTQYLYLDSETRNIVSVDIFKGQLGQYALTHQPGNQELLDAIAKAKYTEKDLVKMATAINGNDIKQQIVLNNTLTRAFIGVSINRNRLSFELSDIGGAFQNGTSASSFSGTLSAGLDFIANKNTQKVVFRLEAALSYVPFNVSDANSNKAVTHTLNFKQTSISFVPQVIYNFYATDKMKVFGDIGCGINAYKYSKHSYISYNVNGTTTQTDDYPEFETFKLNFPLKAGVQVKNLQIYAGYTIPVSLTSYLYWQATFSTAQIGVNYLFK